MVHKGFASADRSNEGPGEKEIIRSISLQTVQIWMIFKTIFRMWDVNEMRRKPHPHLSRPPEPVWNVTGEEI